MEPRSARALSQTLWVWFLVYTALIAAVWVSGFGEAQLNEWFGKHLVTPEQYEAGVRSPLVMAGAALLPWLDFAWVAIATALAYFSLVLEVGLRSARWRAAALLLAGLLLHALGKHGPFAEFHVTERLFPALASIRLEWLLYFLLIVIGARSAAAWALPRVSVNVLGGVTALLACVTDVNLETLASGERAFWLWLPAAGVPPTDPPFPNMVVWALAGQLFAKGWGTPIQDRPLGKGPPHAAQILLLLNALCLLTHLVHRWRP